jgi:hypothetical protein
VVFDYFTGSAHTVLCPYWSDVLNKTRLLGKPFKFSVAIVKIVQIIKLSTAIDIVVWN